MSVIRQGHAPGEGIGNLDKFKLNHKITVVGKTELNSSVLLTTNSNRNLLH
ncbi:MAG: hypothetical protein QNJ34_23780 [Xenococcaceae cyanobacterium MO_188.B29]|nr:hypothetical protein [Xenococcaceae cyanobacterium MO_188.B29]